MEKFILVLCFILFLFNISPERLWSDAAILNIIQEPGGGTVACK
jgi:hypothetical protein